MFKFGVNDIVVYGTSGVCRISGVDSIKLGRETNEYYVLSPVSNSGSSVFVPVDNELLLSKVRNVLTKKEVEAVFATLPADKELWSNNPAERSRVFSEALKSGDMAQAAITVRTLIAHRHTLSESGKKLHLTDERMLREALRLLTDEVAYVFDMDNDEAEEYILNNL